MTTDVRPIVVGSKAHNKLRETLHQDIEKFLNDGGIIAMVDAGVSADSREAVDVLIDGLDKVSKFTRTRSRVFAIYDGDKFFGRDEEDLDLADYKE